ncbi:hypothetical protein Cgig2_034191 [Carnegiea gigantea]|uniref:Phytocyanin domain-containing protein n=1 Tax=Carnegiea gigantea TaxID=171969 RepID=A0A9Q1JML3_9CARY|nr:hypothetical protein Cgig2_034191 [Carnegiea gigantea]
MLSSPSTSFILLCSLLAGAALIISPVTATDHIVGANKGWNPGINYTLWANNHTFYVGDFISFRYKKNMHNVFEVNETGYDKCTTEGAIGNWTSGKDFIPLKKPGRYYFICGSGGCSSGMKVTILVHPLSPPPSASVTATEHSSASTNSTKSAATRVLSGVVSGGLLVGFAFSVLLGCGWM